tara:strand:+ start:551 stop:2092 length:1542 start_codon:yes stop_codon:yes gene_type:complete
MRQIINICFVVFFTSFAFSQQVSESSVYKVYNDIIHAIGNNNPPPPELKLINSKKKSANYIPRKNTIEIANKVLKVCYSFGKDSLNALSYILAHELGHHYRGHGYMTQFASLDFSNQIDQEKEAAQQSVDDETEADIYAGFYAHIAGYDALSLADKMLEKIYREYNLPDSLPNYPTLEERKKVIVENRSQFQTLKIIFDAANISMLTGHYDYAQELFRYILNKGFTSREIYNNLGLCYVYEALDLGLENIYFNLILPFELDVSSRLETESITRSIGTKNKAVDHLYSAIKEFEIANDLDPDYSLAKKNIYFSQIALSLLGEDIRHKLFTEDILSLENTCEFCAQGFHAFVYDKSRKSKSNFKKGSRSCNICEINADFNAKKNKYQDINNSLNDVGYVDDCYFGTYDCSFYTRLITTKLCINDVNDLMSMQLKRKWKGKSSCLDIKEINASTDSLVNFLNVHVGDPVDSILNNWQNLKITNAFNKKYISIVDQNLIFVTNNEVVEKWYAVTRVD